MKSWNTMPRKKTVEVVDEHHEFLRALADVEKRLLWRVVGDVIELGLKHYVAKGGKQNV